jgi:hypothetical protein
VRKLVLTDQAKADLAGLDRATRLRIAAALQRLVQNNAGNIKKLQGIDPPEYPDSGTIRVNRVLNRREAYR